MPKTSDKSVVGRQSQLPFLRAFKISLNSLKIRFWRSIITAGGIFLGIAFLTTVLTQSLMQWPTPAEVDPGYVKIEGQVNASGFMEAWKPVPVSVGLEAGIPEDVVKKVANGKDAFSLADVVTGMIEAKRADKNLARVKEEWKGLKPLEEPLSVYLAAKDDAEIKVSDAVKAGVPSSVAKQLADNGKVFQGSLLVDEVRGQPDWIKPLHYAAILDQDISMKDGIKAGVPPAIVRHLVGDGRTFRATAFNDAIKAHPNWIKIWTARVKRNAIFHTVNESVVEKLGNKYAVTLNEALAEAKNPAKDADMTNVMVVNEDGRKIAANFQRHETTAGEIKLTSGDYILVPDRNTRYRVYWLVTMSLLVCAVGIMNSMLMAVTERFKEIGTMKCLGALDKFVVTLFMLESGMMGIVASILGWAVGFLLMILLAGFTRGWDIVAGIQIIGIIKLFFVAIFVGMFLTVIATIVPALRAANMPAAMALRSEI